MPYFLLLSLLIQSHLYSPCQSLWYHETAIIGNQIGGIPISLTGEDDSPSLSHIKSQPLMLSATESLDSSLSSPLSLLTSSFCSNRSEQPTKIHFLHRLFHLLKKNIEKVIEIEEILSDQYSINKVLGTALRCDEENCQINFNLGFIDDQNLKLIFFSFCEILEKIESNYCNKSDADLAEHSFFLSQSSFLRSQLARRLLTNHLHAYLQAFDPDMQFSAAQMQSQLVHYALYAKFFDISDLTTQVLDSIKKELCSFEMSQYRKEEEEDKLNNLIIDECDKLREYLNQPQFCQVYLPASSYQNTTTDRMGFGKF